MKKKNSLRLWETQLTKKRDSKEMNKKLFMSFLLVFLCTSSIFAAGEDGIAAIKSIFATVYDFFTSGFVKIIALGGLVWIGIKMITNRGESQVVRSLVPWALAALLIGSASFFCDLFLGESFNVDEAISGASSWL